MTRSEKLRAGGDDEDRPAVRAMFILRPVHAHRPQIQRMGRRQTALAHEGDDGGMRILSMRATISPVALMKRRRRRPRRRLLRLFQKAAGGANLLGVAAVGGLVGGQVHRIGYSNTMVSPATSLGMSISTGPGRPVTAMWEGLADGAGELVGGLQQIGVLDHGHRDAHDVGLLERVGADDPPAHLAGDDDEGHGVQ